MSWSIRSLEPGPEAPEEFAPGPGSLKRLTDAEFRNSLRDVLGEVTLGDLEPDSLATVEGVRAQAERLLGSVRGRESVGNFATELFRLAIVRGRAKDPERFPSYTLTLQEAMAREVPAMFQSVVFDERAAALDLFTTRRTFVNRELACTASMRRASATSRGCPSSCRRMGCGQACSEPPRSSRSMPIRKRGLPRCAASSSASSCSASPSLIRPPT
jgi:hypothetical protein